MSHLREPGQERLLALWTRDPKADAATGRGKIVANLRRIMDANFEVRHLTLRHVLDPQSRGRFNMVARSLVMQARERRVLPLQCQIYAAPGQMRELIDEIESFRPSLLYCDGIRAAALLPEIRRRYPGLRIVLDMDDMMSRRWKRTARTKCGLNVGFMEQYLPARVTRLKAANAVARLLPMIEYRSLAALERASVPAVDVAIFAGSHEADFFRRYIRRTLGRDVMTSAVPPAVRWRRFRPWDDTVPIRFVFIGTDKLLQNRLTIEYLAETWRRLQPGFELHIFGRLGQTYPTVEGVRYRGFADDLGDVYAPGSILISPSFLRGGLKTKVLEAFSFSCPVLGNAVTFESIPLARSYPLRFSDDELERFLLQPTSAQEIIALAAGQGHALVEKHFRAEVVEDLWIETLRGRSSVPVRGTVPA